MLFYVEYREAKGFGLTKGFLGLFNPKDLGHRGNELYWTVLPGIASEHWVLGYYPNLSPLRPLPATLKTFKKRRAASLLLPPGHSRPT